MVTVEPTEHLKEAEDKSVLNDAEGAHWFFRVPCAGVRYFAYGNRPVNSCSTRTFSEPLAHQLRTNRGLQSVAIGGLA